MAARRSLFIPSRGDWHHLSSLARPYRKKIALLSLASFATGAVEAVFLVVVTRIALSIADDKETTGTIAGLRVSIPVALVIAGVIIAVRLMCSIANALLASSLTAQASEDLRGDLAGAFLASSWNTQQNEPAGRLQQLVTGFVDQAVSALNSLANVITMGLNLVAMVLITLFVDLVASILVILVLGLLAVCLAPIRSRIRARSRANMRAKSVYAIEVGELGAMGLEMQAFGVVDRFATTIGEMSKRIAQTTRRVNFLTSAMPHFYATFAFLAVILGLIVASIVGVRELSAVGAVMLVLLRSLGYGQQLQSALGGLSTSVPFLDEISVSRERYVREVAPRGHVPIETMGTIQVANVSYSYPTRNDAIVDLSCAIEPGDIVGVIGPSGSGKSTLVQLLLGLREPTSGSIAVGGVPLVDVERASWTKVVAFVSQEPHLFTGTVAENIRFFREGLDDAHIEQAARDANILDEIRALPEGFDTHIGQRGVQLSGGQRQRISIARALVGNPRLLILDEPTSALDVRSEALIRDTVAALRGEVTVVIIAHRLSTLDMCDRLMVIEGGKLAAFDTPAHLRANSAFYRQALEISGIA